MKAAKDLSKKQLVEFVERVQLHARNCMYLEDSEGFLDSTIESLEKLELEMSPVSPWDDDEDEEDVPVDANASGW